MGSLESFERLFGGWAVATMGCARPLGPSRPAIATNLLRRIHHGKSGGRAGPV